MKGAESMFHHFILLHSDYSHGRRIAFHKYDLSISGINDVLQVMGELKYKFPHLSFGFHHLQTDFNDWKSVYEYDMFFRDVYPVTDLESFTRLITDDEQVSALDIANLITSRISCTHLKLQKLIYFFYSEYIKKHKNPPFAEKFYAWDYGPVIPEVYDKYKIYGRSNIGEGVEDNTKMIIKEEPFKLSVYSRFKKTLMYGRFLDSLDITLEKFGDLSANDLVDITHLPETPWDKVYRKGVGRNGIIETKLIEEYTV